MVFLTILPRGVLAHVQPLARPEQGAAHDVVVREMIVYDDVADEGKVKIYDKGVYERRMTCMVSLVQVHSGDIYIPKIEMVEPLRNECAHFVECIEQGTTPRTDGYNGLRVVQVLEAAQRSLDEGGIAMRVA